jgi:hypothetical protein
MAAGQHGLAKGLRHPIGPGTGAIDEHFRAHLQGVATLPRFGHEVAAIVAYLEDFAAFDEGSARRSAARAKAGETRRGLAWPSSGHSEPPTAAPPARDIAGAGVRR